MVIFPLAPDQTIAQMWSNEAQRGSGMREAALSELGSASSVDIRVGGSETRSTAGTGNCLNAVG